MKLDFDLIDSETGKVYAKAGEKFNIVIQKKLSENSVKNLFLDNSIIYEKFLATDIFDTNTGIIYFRSR